MNEQARQKTIEKILDREKLFKLRGGRLQRLVSDPLRTFPFYVLSVFARIRPVWVTHKTLWDQDMSYYLPEGNQVYYYGFYEANLTIFLIRLLREGDQFIDVGANIGFYSVLAAALVGTTGKVFSVEPTPRTFEHFSKTSAPLKNITPIHAALSDKMGTIKIMDYGARLSAFNTLNPRTSNGLDTFLKNGIEVEVPMTTLDELSRINHFKPAFIKMDAEGYESTILKGGLKLLDSARPIVSVEMGKDPEWRKNVDECFRIFKEKEYASYEISADGYLVPRAFDAEIETNMVFVPKEKVPGLKSLMAASH